MLIDSHAHLDFSQFDDDRDAVIRRARDADLAAIINIGTDRASSEKSMALSARDPLMYAAVGVHPHDAATLSTAVLDRLAELAEQEKVVAIGEIGLDYYRNLSPRDRQREAFRRQIRLAIELGLPLVIHDRDAHAEVLAILRREGADRVGGVLHCFSGDLKMAWEGIAMGFLIAFGGPITYGGGRKQQIARQIPLNRILIETDCPFLTPAPHRGRRNEPAYVRHVAEKLAQLRGITFEQVATATTRNAVELFGLSIEKERGKA
jgi:TatD DNase family protein